MKLLFYCDTVFSVGGVQKVLAYITKSLSLEHDITILTTDTNIDKEMYNYNSSKIKFDYITYSESGYLNLFLRKSYSFLYKFILPQNKFTSKIYSYSYFSLNNKKKLINKINNGNYDIVIGVHAFLSLHISSVSNKLNCKTIGWLHNSYEALFLKDNPYLPKLETFFRYEISKLDKVIVLSKSDKELFTKNMSLPTNVIYNPLTVEIKGSCNLMERKFLSIGRFTSGHKGFDILINAFSEFAKSNKEWCLVIVGEGSEEPILRKIIKDKKLEDRVSIYPFTNNIEEFYRNTSIYVLSSRWEGLPLVLLEALGYGMPIISSDIPIAIELLESKNIASFFKSEDINSLTIQLENAIKENCLKGKSRNAKEYSNEFKIEYISKMWNELFIDVLK